MALRHAIESTLLVMGEASGYDLSKEFDGARATFWMAAPQQLYRELDKMEADGVIVARTVEQEKRPNKRVFRLTSAGRAELREFTAGSPRQTAIRDELMVMVQAIDVADPIAVGATIRERREGAIAKLAYYDRIERRWLGERSREQVLADPHLAGPYLTLLRGMRFERENLDWYELALPVIEARAAGSGR
ncbi:PadR family transcriptional regulator [Tsukamurella spumae]|uniref:PadR family transcriptional regulator n=1 Tax=Tsukamurella spumae TaxID=44753 RepID=A0A846WZK5_9ACTN|nr:PadR family transcriptional regulator [Tsukamurella spumae]NKY17170.1 PadR family transcriptional regulator [Tsukamurella spumae]